MNSAPIAIVGIGCRLPGAAGPRRFWQLLRDGVDAIRVVPANRWDAEALYDPDTSAPGKMNTRWGGFLDDLEGFDSDHFRISKREAERMDPQQRIVLEVAWEALEDAGIPTHGLAGSNTGVYVGASTYDHGSAVTRTTVDPEPYDGTGAALSILANRLSYCLDLRGPSLAIDTACSSSLVAAHMACQALRSGEADLALAGGVNVITHPGIAMSFSKGGLMAPDGRCKTFDHRADGYVRSEGTGVVVLKPLERALTDGDRIYALIEGSAINQDGRTNGLTAPNRLAQEAVLRAAYEAAGVNPAEVDYVEAHGTGTAVGDPIEVGALATVLGAGRAADAPLRLGSAKSNVGHLEAAAGVTGLIKTALALYREELPPSIHFERPNPLLKLEQTPIVIQRELEDWPDRDRPALAGVSSFGFGGTNCHLVMSAAPAATKPLAGQGAERARQAEATQQAPPTTLTAIRQQDARTPMLLPISARSAALLARRAAAWVREANAHTDDAGWLARVAAAAALRTDHHDYRAAIVATDTGELASAMNALAAGEPAPGLRGPRRRGRRAPRLVLVFPGQGVQWAGMGATLARRVPAFQEAIRRCDKAIARCLGHSLWSDEGGLEFEGMALLQPAIFAMQVALAETWRAWGLEWAAVVGHSLGEIAAAQLAGAISLDDAAQIVCERSRLLQGIIGSGGSALVELSAAEASVLIEGSELTIGATNGPRATVLSGSTPALEQLLEQLSERGIFARRIASEVPAHGVAMEPLQPLLRAALQELEPREGSTPIYSTVRGEPISGAALNAEYWAQNLRQPVLFAPAVERLLADGHRAFLEVSPHPTLTRSVAETASASEHEVEIVASMHRDENELRGMLSAVGELHTLGVSFDWQALHADEETARAADAGDNANTRGVGHVELPAHGWEHRRFPLPRPGQTSATVSASVANATADGQRTGGLLARPIRVGAMPSLRLWALELNLRSAPELADHLVEGTPLVPGAYWLGAVAEAVGESSGSGPVRLRDVTFEHPFLVSEESGADLQLGLRSTREGTGELKGEGEGKGEGERSFDISSWTPTGQHVRHAHGVVCAPTTGEGSLAEGTPTAIPTPNLQRLRDRCPTGMAVEQLYAELERVGLGYGPRFRGLSELQLGAREALARVQLPQGLGKDQAPLHPALLDTCLHTVAAAAREQISGAALPLPVGAERLWMRDKDEDPPVSGWCHARIIALQEGNLIAELTVFDDAGALVVWASRLRVRLLVPRRRTEEGRLYELAWSLLEREMLSTGGGNWLLLADRIDVARALERRLTAAGGRCVLAVAKPAQGPHERVLDPGEEAPYELLLAEAERHGGGLRGVIDARALSTDAAELKAPALHEIAARALRLAQAVIERSKAGAAASEQPRLWLLSARSQAGAAANPAALGSSSLWGLGRVIDSEHPELGCSLVDFQGPLQERGLDALGDALCDPDAPRQLLVRGEQLLAPSLVPLPAATGAATLHLRADRSYLVTGGLGTLGLLVAGWLLTHGARRLLLIGRGAPSPQAERELERLRATGAEVRVELLDVADTPALADVLYKVGASEHPLAGVIHAAGVLEDGLVSSLDPDRLQAAFAGKALGAWNLHSLTRDQPLELFVLFSSLAGLLGSPGQAAYAAASAFLDSLAAHRAALGLPGVSIDWGPWAGSGLAVEVQGVERLAARGVPPLDPTIALELLDQALDSGRAQVAAAAFDWRGARSSRAGEVARELLGDLVPETNDSDSPRGAMRDAVLEIASPAEREQTLCRLMAEQVASVLRVKVSEIDVTIPFQSLGFDSLMAIELRDRLEVALDTRLSAALLFAHPTVDSLAEGLLERLAPAAEQTPAMTATTGNSDSDAPTPTPEEDLSGLDEHELATLLSSELQLHSGSGDA